MLSAFVGSVANGLFSGFWIAFFTGWISWLSFIRILAAGFYEFWLSIRSGTNLHISQADIEYSHINMLPMNQSPSNQPNHDPNSNSSTIYKPKPAIRTVTIFGWLGWIWSAIYTPLSHSIWLSVHINSTQGPILLVRALAIGVSALGLTFDYKARYGAKLGTGWLYLTFNLWNSSACLLLGIEATILLIKGVLHVNFTPIPLLVVYPLFSILWAVLSWRFLPPIDAARPGINLFADVAMGCFAGIFCAAPAFALYQSARADEKWAEKTAGFGIGDGERGPVGLGLGPYLRCEGVTALERFAAIMP